MLIRVEAPQTSNKILVEMTITNLKIPFSSLNVVI